MIIPIILLAIGLAILIKFSDFTVKSAIKLSKLSGINQMAIGFILIALATSIPELSIAITSSFDGHSLISFGNLMGSNISNIALIFGILSLVGFTIPKKDYSEIADALILTSLISLFILSLGTIDAVFGVFLIISFALFSRIVMKKGIIVKEKEEGIRTFEIVKSVGIILISVFMVWIGAKVVIDNVMIISQSLIISNEAISAIILGIGTTLPELSVAVMAIKNKDMDLAIGDGIGSIVTNLTLILGIATIINPITIDVTGSVLLGSLILINLLFLFLARKMRFGIKEGLILITAYIIFFIVIMTGMFL